MSYWLWPLPGEGVLQITCEWPIAGIPVSTSELATAARATSSAEADESGGALDDVAAELRRAQRSLARALASLERLRQ